MKMKKLFPPQLSQMVFLNSNGDTEKINSLDYDLFIWLIYKTHQHYHNTQKTTMEFDYSKVRESLKSKPNTKSLKNSLEKLDAMQIEINYLQSYGDKKIIRIKPFHIEVVKSDNGKSYGFIVKTSKRFLQRFTNPTSNVEVDYNIIYNLNKMSKLLYLFLKDSLGIYESKNRNVDIDKLRDMINISNIKTSNSNFISQLKKSVTDINENSNITVDFTTVKKRDLKSGISEIKSVKFTIKKDEEKLLNKRCSDVESIVKTKTDEESSNDTVSVDFTFDDFIKNRVEEIYQTQLSNGIEIQNVKSYKSGIRKKLLEDGIEDEFELVSFLDNTKSKLRYKITDNQPYMIIFKEIDNPYESYYFNNDYKLLNSVTHKVTTTTINETMEFIDEKLEEWCFDIQRCGWEMSLKLEDYKPLHLNTKLSNT